MRHKSSETTLNKKVLLIGNLAQEGITTKITALGHIYQQRHLLTTPLNWMTIEKNINQLRTSGELFAVFVNLIESAIFHSCSPEYQEVWQLLLIELKQTASLIFVCEDNLLGKFSSVESVSLNRQLTQAQIKKDEALKTIADAQKSRDEAEQAIVNAQKSRDEAEQAIVNAQKSKSKADRAIAEAQKRKVKADRAIADTQKRIATAVEQAIAEKRIATAVEQAIAEAQKSKNEAEQAIANAQKSRDEAEQAIADTQKRIATAVEQDEAEKSRDEAEQAIVNAQKSRDEADRTITDAQKRKVKADRAIAEAQKSKARPEQTFAEAHRRKTTAEQAIVNAQKSRDEADRTIAEVQKERVKRLPERVPRAEQLLKDIQRSGVEVVPYKRKEEITFRIQQFLDEVDNGVFLHLYVPNGRYQADQLANFLRLFENYSRFA